MEPTAALNSLHTHEQTGAIPAAYSAATGELRNIFLDATTQHTHAYMKSPYATLAETSAETGPFEKHVVMETAHTNKLAASRQESLHQVLDNLESKEARVIAKIEVSLHPPTLLLHLHAPPSSQYALCQTGIQKL
jgi:hypothetical protein